MSKYKLDKYSYLRGVNVSSTVMVEGTLVYISNWNSGEPEFDLAISTDSSKYATGIVLETIPIGGRGRILTEGKLKLDNKGSTLSEGDVLYLSNVAGEYTTTAPVDVYKVGEVIKSNTNTVTVFFSPDFLIPAPVIPHISVLFIQTANTTVSNTITENTIIGTGVGTMTIPANTFTVGKTLRLTWRGILSDTGTPTLRIRVKIGSTTIGDTGAIALVGSITNEEWHVNYIMTCRSTGVTGTVYGQGDFHFDNSASEGLTFGMPSTSATTIDTTTSQLLSITVQWGTADVNDTITSTNGILESLN